MSTKLVTYETLLNNVESKLTAFNNLSTSKSELIEYINTHYELQDNMTMHNISKTVGEIIQKRQDLIDSTFSLKNKTSQDLEIFEKINQLENELLNIKEQNLDNQVILETLKDLKNNLEKLEDSNEIIVDLNNQKTKLDTDISKFMIEIEQLLHKESSISNQVNQLTEYITNFTSWLENIKEEIQELKETESEVTRHQNMYEFNKKMLSQKPHITSTYDRILELSKNADDFKNATKSIFNLLNIANQLQNDFEETCKFSADEMKNIEEQLYSKFNNESKDIFNQWNVINARISELQINPNSMQDLDSQIEQLNEITIPENSIQTDYLLLSPKGKHYDEVNHCLENLANDYNKIIENLDFIKNEKKLAKEHLTQVENKRHELEKRLNIVSNIMEQLIVFGQNIEEKEKKIYSLEKVKDSLNNHKNNFDDLLQIASLLGSSKSVEITLRKAHRLIAQYHNKEKEVKEAILRAQNSLDAHKSYNEYYKNYDSWLDAVNLELEQTESAEAIEKLSIKAKNEGAVKLSILQGRSAKASNLTHPEGQFSITDQTKNIEEKFDSLCDAIHTKKAAIVCFLVLWDWVSRFCKKKFG